MDFLAGFYLPGAVALWAALLFALCSLFGYTQLATGNGASLSFARRAYSFYAGAVVLASLVLSMALLRRDFRIDYVYNYSGVDLPNAYQFAAFWAGQKGSFLIWLLWAALIGVLLYRTAGKNEATVMGVYLLTTMSLLLLLVRENPFHMLAESPADGKGLNPLLQDPWMVIHPPIMFIGYALSAVPFAFAISALWRKDYSDWAARSFPWALFGCAILGVAILLGGYWAYKTLGWGGFWGWDPVENASLIPWLIGVALVHGLHLEKTQRRYRRANLVLAVLVFLAVLYGTYLTRSGVLADFSVHSFVDFGIKGWLVAILAIFGGGGLMLLVTRLGSVETRPNEDEPLSRGFFLVAATVVVMACAVVVTIGTSAPILTRFFEDPGQVGPSFYNTVNLPVAIAIALLLSFIPYLTWRGNEPRQVLKKLAPAFAVALVVTVVAAFLGVHEPFDVLFVLLATLCLVTNLHKVVSLVRTGGWRVAGGYLAHVGVGTILLGVLASSAYDISTKATLVEGQPQVVGEHTLTFLRFLPDGGAIPDCAGKSCMEVEVREGGGGATYLAYPKLFINSRTRQLMANPHIKSHLTEDLYISPIEYHPADPTDGSQQVRLVEGETTQLGDLSLRFVGFELVDGDAHAQLAAGGEIRVRTRIEVARGGRSETVAPLYRIVPNVTADSTTEVLPGGGSIAIESLSPTDRAVIARLVGVGGAVPSNPATVALDVTRKPLIQLVWFGLMLVLAGFTIAGTHRLLQVLRSGPSSPPLEGAA
ncbi:MAG TPA: cytochrome c biogenesis protein CcsA [Thermoanaerobaculia bacterium]|nr:cytochrome c biogenesis protein CcsA [Thermoanaerobaculia bacterium]